MSDVVLDVRNLSVEFPTRKGVLTAVDDISLQIRRGEILGMVGESGAGKSMTGMAILGLLEPPGRIAAGSIHLSGDRIDNLDDRVMQSVRGRRIGAIFQDPPNPNSSWRTNLRPRSMSRYRRRSPRFSSGCAVSVERRCCW